MNHLLIAIVSCLCSAKRTSAPVALNLLHISTASHPPGRVLALKTHASRALLFGVGSITVPWPMARQEVDVLSSAGTPTFVELVNGVVDADLCFRWGGGGLAQGLGI